jgi:hypothetical protein
LHDIISLNQPLIIGKAGCRNGVKGAKQALALALETIRQTAMIF